MTSSAKARQGLTSQLGQLIVNKINSLHVPQLVYGVVSAVSATTPTVSVTLQGTSTVIAGVKYDSTLAFAVGDVVRCARAGTDLFVMGKIATIPTAWIVIGSGGAPALGSGWTQFNASYNPLAIRRLGDIVRMRGSMSASGSGAATTVFTLPTGYRPVLNYLLPFPASGGVSLDLIIESTGVVLLNGTPAAQVYDFDAEWSVL
jgi:hypothetical protein